MFIERHIRKAIEAADRFFPALLLTGARQVGKTTLLRRLAGDGRKYVTFDDAGLRTLALVKGEREVTQSCPTLSDPMDYTVHGILQARILEWVAFLFSRGSSQPRDQTQVSHIAGGFFNS